MWIETISESSRRSTHELRALSSQQFYRVCPNEKKAFHISVVSVKGKHKKAFTGEKVLVFYFRNVSLISKE
jgi:hypothetical protein